MMGRKSLPTSLVFIALILGVGRADDKPLNIGSDKQLFVGPWTKDGRDALLVESMQNVTMTMNEARVTGGRLIEIDKPWEESDTGHNRVPAGNGIIRDGDTWRLYYQANCKYPGYTQDPYCIILCYAESQDGIHWSKPDLGLCKWKGSRDNNILFPNDDFPYEFSHLGVKSVFIDPRAPKPDEKYKMTMKLTPVSGEAAGSTGLQPLPHRKGKYGFVSPDGIHWTMATGRLGKSGDGDFSPLWDERVGKYVAYSRVKKPNDPRQIKYYRDKYGDYELNWRARVIKTARSVSDDFVNWSKPRVVIDTDEIDEVNLAPRGISFHGGEVSLYPEAPDIYIGLPQVFSHWKAELQHNGELSPRPGTVDVQLITSRDGIQWNRAPGRKPLLRMGPEGTFWSKQIRTFPGRTFRVGDELWIFFVGYDVPQHELASGNGGLGRAVLRLDGFISANSAYTGGELVTKPIVFSGSKLQLNCETSAGGFVQVEIQDQEGKPIEGFTAEDERDQINGNYIRVLSTWKGNPDVISLAGKPVRLRFVMRDAKLYSFQFLP